MSYTHLSQDERYQIQTLHRGDWSAHEIGEQLERDPSTISREIARNAGVEGYAARPAHRQSTQRRHAASAQPRIGEAVWPTVEARIAEGWSPKQIAGEGEVANSILKCTSQPSSLTVTTIDGLTSNVLTDLSYEPFGPVSGWTYGNGLTRSYGYDLDRRLTSLATKNGATSLQSLTYGYNTNDLITQITNGVDANQNQGSGYDELSRVSSLTTAGGTQGFVHDANRNCAASGATSYTSVGSGILSRYCGRRSRGR